jgi:hypothetical protein
MEFLLLKKKIMQDEVRNALGIDFWTLKNEDLHLVWNFQTLRMKTMLK